MNTQKGMMDRQLLHVVGIGLEGPAGLSASVQALLASAPLIAGARSYLQHFSNYPARQIQLGSPIESWIERLRQALEQDSVVLLASGDPLFFGIGRLLIDAFPRECLVFYPHVSSVQLAFSRAQIPWQEATMVSVHGRSLDLLEKALKQGADPIALLTDSTHSPAAIAQVIEALRLPCRYRLWVCSQLGSPQEEVVCLSSAAATQQTFPDPNVVILEQVPPEPDPQTWPLLGIPDRDFHTFGDQPGLITKQEVRALTLALLQLPTQGVIWDIGAGTGSVSIEIARLVPQVQVFAIEKNAAGIHLIQRNCERFGVKNVQVIAGTAPAVLADLPSPQRVVLGGGGSGIPQILETVCEVLIPGGVLVGNFATLETCTSTQQILQQRGWSVHLLQVQLSRSVSIAGSTRFSPLNPMTLLQAHKASSLE